MVQLHLKKVCSFTYLYAATLQYLKETILLQELILYFQFDPYEKSSKTYLNQLCMAIRYKAMNWPPFSITTFNFFFLPMR